jgi:hypothetical protein
MTITELAQTIQDRLDVLHREIALLEAARDELERNGSASPQPTAIRPRGVRRMRQATPRRRGEIVAADKLERLLADHSGIASTALADLANGERGSVMSLLRELEAAGRVRRTGQRRGTRWHVITDEDRVQARAAELERQSKRARSAGNRTGRTA